MEDIKTDGLLNTNLFGKMDERTSRSGKIFSKRHDKKESFPEETKFDEETLTNLKKCMQEESLKRKVDKIDTKSNALVNSNKEFTLDLKKKTTCPVSYQPKNDKIGNDSIYQGIPFTYYQHPDYDNRDMTSCMAPKENNGQCGRKFEMISPLKLKKKTTCPVSYQPKKEEVGNYDHDYMLGSRWDDCAPCASNQLRSSNYDNRKSGAIREFRETRNMSSFRAREETYGSWSRKSEFNPNVDEYFLNHLTPGQDCMNPNEAFSKSPKKIKLSSLKKESIKNHVCKHQGCAQKFDRVGQG